MNTASNVFELGFAKRDITPPPNGELLFGYVDPKHRALSVAMPIHARAVVIAAPGARLLALVCLEICSVGQSLRDAILERIRKNFSDWSEDDLIVCATHTHCAPGGHYHDVLYSVASLGWYPHVLERYAEGAAAAILEARARMKPGRIRFAEGEVPVEKPVAFNRSIKSWNLNPDVTKYTFSERARALDRTMRHYRFEDTDGRFLGCVNDFAVHCTSMHRDQNATHPDNKGVAADLLEKEAGGVCLFIQGAAGDVSPNFQKFKGLVETRGTNPVDLIATAENGRMQADVAKELNEKAKSSTPLSATLKSVIEYVDMSAVEVDSRDVGGKKNCRTGPAVIGAKALLGTEEGMPTPKILFYLIVVFARISDVFASLRPRPASGSPVYLWGGDPVQGPKVGCIQSGYSEVFRSSSIHKFPFPDFADPLVAKLKSWAKKNITSRRPMTPQILPIQLVQLGEAAWVVVPAEFTTMSGRRLKASVLKDFEGQRKAAGVLPARAMLIGYANSYSGYVTTPEEYQCQAYEGASTHFGQWTQPAYQTLFRRLVNEISMETRPARSTILQPLRPTAEELEHMRAAELGFS